MNARNRLVNFAMSHGERYLAMTQRLESYVDECATQLVVTTEIERTNALLTRPTPKWQNFCDSTAARNPLPTLAMTFKTMLTKP